MPRRRRPRAAAGGASEILTPTQRAPVMKIARDVLPPGMELVLVVAVHRAPHQAHLSSGRSPAAQGARGTSRSPANRSRRPADPVAQGGHRHPKPRSHRTSPTSTTATNASCPSSMPTLKANSASGISPWGSPTSASAPAKPRPWSNPNPPATSQGQRCTMVTSAGAAPHELDGQEVDAERDGGFRSAAWGTRTRPSDARASVTLWPTVKAVIVQSSAVPGPPAAPGPGRRRR